MSGLLSAINAGQTSLEVNQKSLEVIGNNIANVNTEGYSRQEAVIAPHPSLTIGDFFIGNGVHIGDVQREHDVFIEQQIREKAVDFGFQDALTRPLSELERIFKVSDNSLSTDIDNFFDSLQELSADPSDLVQRNNVILQGNSLATSFNNIDTELSNIQENINDTVISKLNDVNSQLDELADLNQRIFNIESTGQTANGARDQRDKVLRDLSITLGAESYIASNGMASVQLPGGLPLVQGNMAMKITAETTGTRLSLKLHAGGSVKDITQHTIGGEFRGYMEIRDNFIPELREDLDKLAYELSVQVNLQHMAGGGLDSSTGNVFFTVPPNYVASPPGPPPTAAEYNGAARAMQVAITDPVKVAAAAAPDPGPPVGTVSPGDNRNALILSNIGDTYLVDGTDSFTSMYGLMAAKVGVESNQNQLSLKGAEDALVQLDNFRDGLVGVSLEEEMIELIQYQRGFESSAKFLSIVDEMMESVIALKR